MPPRRTRASTASNASTSSKARSTRAATAQDSSEEDTKPVIKRATSARKKKAAPVIEESESEAEQEPEEEPVQQPTVASESEESNNEDEETAAPPSGQRKEAIVKQEAASSSESDSEEEDEEVKTPPPASPSLANAADPVVADSEEIPAPLTPPAPEEPVYMPPKAKEPEKPRERLVIHKIVLVNFKSYAGRVEIGPFHTSFSAIVGPNGSGKSNTIDALLFVFGYRASKMRQGKLSELIHNSEGKMDLDFCAVEVHFREIIDLPGDGNHSVVPGSSLIVSRQAFRDNKSKYTINSRNSTYTEVVTLLKDKGIDLDHKRFLILQGEVESIAQMKPKGATEHEDGLLEYLEDIIGTSDYKEPIEKALEDVDRLNEERGEKLARVKLVEREKKNLESRKKEADEYLKNLNDKAILDSKIWQHHRLTTQRNIEHVNAELTEAKAELEHEQAKNAGVKKDFDKHQTMYTEAEEALKDIETAAKSLEKELAVFDRTEVQLSEQKKHFSARQKKLSKTLTDDSHAKSEASNTSRDSKSAVEKFTKEISKLEKELEQEEQELDKIRDSLKGKTEGISAQIEVKQAELQPWAAKVSEKQAARAVAVGERDLLQERVTSVERAIEEAEASIAKFKQTASTSQAELTDLKQDQRTAQRDLADALAKLEAIKGKNANLRKSASSARQKADEAKASQLATKSQSNVLRELTKLKDQGRLSGFHGRLGDLGSIEAKYDVAISTACPGLNNLVCDTVEDGQACLENLRRTRSGRAVIICLTVLQKYNLEPIATPEDVPRLFDLVKTKDDKYRPAFYQLLRDTLVAKDLEQANRIAYGQKRYRVVTVSGELIDTSGTMSGGGSRPAKGLMGAKISADEYSPQQVASFEREYEKADGELRNLADDQSSLEEEIARLQKRPIELSTAITKAEMTVKSANQRAQDTQRRIEELRAQAQPEAGDLERIQSLEATISKAEKEIAKLTSNTDAIEAEIQSLQDQILAIGGTKLRVQQGKVQDLKERIDHASDRLTKSEVAGAKADKDILKLDKAIEQNTAAVAEADEQLDVLNKQIKDNSRAAETIRANTEEARELVAGKREELAELKVELEHKLAAIQKFRTAEAKLEQMLKKLEDNSAKHLRTMNECNAKLAEIELQEIDEDDDEDEPNATEGDEEARPPAREPVELREYSEQELDDMDVQALVALVAVVEETIERARPNLEVLKEYQARERQFMERAKEFDDVTAQRDQAKQLYENLRKERLEKFMGGFSQISLKLKEMYQMITLGGNAELELVDSLDPFSEGIVFSVMPPKKSWKHISNLSGGEKTLSSLALVFALHVFKPTPLYFMDEIDAALDFRNVSIVANYISQRTKNAQFIIISLRNNMFELASRLVGIYKTSNCTKSITIDNAELAEAHAAAAQ